MNRKCKVCGKEYDFCPQCRLSVEPEWLARYDKKECLELDCIFSGYICEIVDAQHTYEKLLPYNLENKNLEPKFKNAYEEILSKIPVME